MLPAMATDEHVFFGSSAWVGHRGYLRERLSRKRRMRVTVARTHLSARFAANAVEFILERHDLDFVIIVVVRRLPLYQLENVAWTHFEAAATPNALALIERHHVLGDPSVPTTSPS